MPLFQFIVRGWTVPDSNARPVQGPPPKHSPVVKHLRVSLKFLAAYGVALVNGAALLYIILKFWRYLIG